MPTPMPTTGAQIPEATTDEAQEILELAASKRRTLTYTDFANAMSAEPLHPSVPAYRHRIGQILDAVADRTLAERGVILPVIVVKKGTCRPGQGFFDYAARHRKGTPPDQLVLDEMARVFKAYS